MAAAAAGQLQRFALLPRPDRAHAETYTQIENVAMNDDDADAAIHVYVVMAWMDGVDHAEAIYVATSSDAAMQFLLGVKNDIADGKRKDDAVHVTGLLLVKVKVGQEIEEGLVNEPEIFDVKITDRPEPDSWGNVLSRLTMAELVDPALKCQERHGVPLLDPVEFGVPPPKINDITLRLPIIPDKPNLKLESHRGMKSLVDYVQAFSRTSAEVDLYWLGRPDVIRDSMRAMMFDVYKHTGRGASILPTAIAHMKNTHPSIAYKWFAARRFTVESALVDISRTGDVCNGVGIWVLVRGIMLFAKDARRQRAVMHIGVRERESGHANLLLVWRIDADIFAMVYDPHGSIATDEVRHAITPVLALAGVTQVFVPYEGTQNIERKLSHMQREDEEGYCAAWCIAVAEMFARFPAVPPAMMLQLLHDTLSRPNDALRFIRNYVAKLRELVTDKRLIPVLPNARRPVPNAR